MTKAQKLVAAGSLSGVLFMLAGLWVLTGTIDGLAAAATSADRLAFAAKWNAVAIIPLFLAIAAVGNERFKCPSIDPLAGKPSAKMVVNNRVVDNTVQQFLLFATATLAVATSADGNQIRIVAAAAIVFVILRIAFWIGYRIDPIYRAFGMGGTMYLNLFLLGYSLWTAHR